MKRMKFLAMLVTACFMLQGVSFAAAAQAKLQQKNIQKRQMQEYAKAQYAKAQQEAAAAKAKASAAGSPPVAESGNTAVGAVPAQPAVAAAVPPKPTARAVPKAAVPAVPAVRVALAKPVAPQISIGEQLAYPPPTMGFGTGDKKVESDKPSGE